MTFPFDALSGSQRELGLVLAVAIGFAFGFVLERAGFGRATRLAAQFYLRDMTVFKVMFSAIVTAMLGLVLFDAAGLVDFASVREQIASFTWIGPMLVGGFVLGIGFILSGYCPGTSLVAGASGNVDGMVTVGGVVAGSWLYSELLRIPAFAAFHASGDRGPMFLDDLLGVSHHLLAAAIAAAAIAAFVGAEKVESIFRRDRVVAATTGRGRRFAFATMLAFGLLSAMSFAFHEEAPSPAPPADVRTIDAATLARRIVERPWELRILDLRREEEFGAARVPGSERIDPSAAGDLGLEWADPSRDLVVVGPADAPLPEAILAYRGTLLRLEGGFDAWRRWALEPPEPATSVASASELEFRRSVQAMLTGAPPPPPPAASPATPVARPRKKGGGCSV